ncbi:MAG: DUF2807 domain-containing protein [Marinilabiliales bacterium]|nr:DUF2807 domain-containing protein [Marinilabiliales bacterium]
MKKLCCSLLFLSLLPFFSLAQKTVTYDLPAFTEISLKNDAKLILKQDSVQSVMVKANEETIKKMSVELSGKKLIIRYPNNSWFDTKWTPGEVTVYVSMPQIDALSQSGSGTILAEGNLTSRILELYDSGSGSIQLLHLKADKISATVAGSGMIQLDGQATNEEFKMMVSGSGSVKAPSFKSKHVSVIITGSGNCIVHAEESLHCKIAGSGGVTYYGNPSIEQTLIGSGKVKEGK